MASSCHFSVFPKKSIEKARKLKMCKDFLLSDLMFNKERFCLLLEIESQLKKRFC